MTENNTAKTATAPAINGAGEAVIATPKARSTRAKKAAAKPTTPAKATKAATEKKAPAKAAAASKAPAKAAAASKAPAKGKAPAKAAVLTTKSGVSHPGPLWRALLDEQGMTRMTCAKEMGVAPMTLHRYLEGNGIPTAKVTVAFARVTKQNAKKVWAQVCDYELALVLEADEAPAAK